MTLPNREMKCPHCESLNVSRNGHRRSKQNYLCNHCGRQFLEAYSPKGYSADVKNICIKMYVNGMTLRAIERITEINHNTISNWLRQAGIQLRKVTQVDEETDDSEIDPHQLDSANAI
jgi:insertion element IS1 protein InsB